MPNTKLPFIHPDRQVLTDAVDKIIIDPKFTSSNPQIRKRITQIQEMWRAYQTRMAVYSDMDGNNMESYEKFNDRWRRNIGVDKNLRVLKVAVDAIIKLEQMTPSEKSNRAKETAMLIAASVMQRIELKQFSHLKKRQEIERDQTYLTNLVKTLRADTKKYRTNVRKLKLAKEFDKINHPELHRLFKRFPTRRFTFSDLQSRIQLAGDIKSVAASSYGAIRTIQSGYPGLMSVADSVGSVLGAVPVLSSIATAIPYVITLIKNWYKRESKVQIGLAVLMLGLVVAGAVISGLAIVGAATIGIIFAGIGFVREQIIPLAKLNREIQRRMYELSGINAKLATFANNSATMLDEADKHALMRLVEDYFVIGNNKFTARKAELLNLKRLISNGRIMDIQHNKLLSDALTTKGFKGPNPLNNYLTHAAKERVVFLNDKLNQLRKARNKRTAFLVNSWFSLVGAALLCVPFPPVMILGASIILATTIISVAIKYNWLGKFKAYLNRKYGNKPAAVQSEDEASEVSLAHTKSLANESVEEKSLSEETPIKSSQNKILSKTLDASDSSAIYSPSTSSEEPKKTETSSSQSSPLYNHGILHTPSSSKEEASESEEELIPKQHAPSQKMTKK